LIIDTNHGYGFSISFSTLWQRDAWFTSKFVVCRNVAKKAFLWVDYLVRHNVNISIKQSVT